LAVIATVLALTYLNPHVYLDTVVFLGSVGAREPLPGQLTFWLGSVLASFAWFFGLGYGARFLRPWLARPKAWRVLDGLIGSTMLVQAIGLATSAVVGVVPR
jgi:L-lysine exporter family protein LysE/ArgO